jgi:acyl-CoA thioester hydrolase
LNKPPVVVRIAIRYGDLDPYGQVNNAVYLGFFEDICIASWRALAALAGLVNLGAGDVPGARYVVAETTARHRGPIFLDHTLHGPPASPPSATAPTP